MARACEIGLMTLKIATCIFVQAGVRLLHKNTFFVGWPNYNELQVFIIIRSLKFLNQCLCNGSTSFKPF